MAAPPRWINGRNRRVHMKRTESIRNGQDCCGKPFAATFYRMLRTVARVGVFVLSVLGPAGARPVFCQAPAATPPPPKPNEESLVARLKSQMKEPDQGGGCTSPSTGPWRSAASSRDLAIALGPAFSNKFANGSYMQLKAVSSIKKFRLLQARYDTRRFWSKSRGRRQPGAVAGRAEAGALSPRHRFSRREGRLCRAQDRSEQPVERCACSPRCASAAGSASNGSPRTRDRSIADELPEFPRAPGLADASLVRHGVFAVGIRHAPVDGLQPDRATCWRAGCTSIATCATARGGSRCTSWARCSWCRCSPSAACWSSPPAPGSRSRAVRRRSRST